MLANVSVGDIIGFGSVLLMNPATQTHQVGDFLAPPKPGEGTADFVDVKDVDFPVYEQVYGELSIPNADILCPLVYGDSEPALKKGAGQYIGSMIVGYPGTTLVCAHVNRQFRNLHNVKVGDTVQVRTTYGVYTYEVKYVGVHYEWDNSVYDLMREDENIVMYTCYYQYTSIGSVKMRFYVAADYVSGPLIKDWGE